MILLEVLVLVFLVCIVDSADVVDGKTKIQTCKTGDVVQNECVQCVCTTKHIYKCATKRCSRTFQHSTQSSTSREQYKPRCRPSIVYTTDTTTCICDKTGHWPHTKCEKVFQTLNDTSNSCQPNSYAILDCNVCHCGPDGNIDKDRCTQNICEKGISQTRRYTNNVYGSCETKNWYSLAPCQFCFCVARNKLVCNTGNFYANKLDLGSYNLTVCGKDLIYEAVALIPDSDKTLRLGNLLVNTTETTLKAFTTSKYVNLQQNRNIVINVNKGKVIENNVKDNQKEKDESYSDSEEDKPGTVKKINEGASTQLPYPEDEEDTSKENGFYSDKNEEQDSGMEIGVEENRQTTPKYKNPVHNNNKTPLTESKLKSAETSQFFGQDLGKTLKMTFPHMLDQMFKMALRKSMLSLTGDTKCVPGATQVIKCNTCFCMKNGKLLCTNNVCE